MSGDAAAEVGDFHVFHDVADGFGGDFGVFGGEVFEAFGGLDEGFRSVADAFLKAVHEGTEGTGFVDFAEVADEFSVHVELEHGLGEVHADFVIEIAEAFGAEDHAVDGVFADDFGTFGALSCESEEELVRFATVGKSEGCNHVVEMLDIFGPGDISEGLDGLSVASLPEELIDSLADGWEVLNFRCHGQ